MTFTLTSIGKPVNPLNDIVYLQTKTMDFRAVWLVEILLCSNMLRGRYRIEK
jgi:hypothetical protein